MQRLFKLIPVDVDTKQSFVLSSKFYTQNLLPYYVYNSLGAIHSLVYRRCSHVFINKQHILFKRVGNDKKVNIML